MALAASLWFDAALEAAVRARWSDLADRGIATLHGGPIRPHVTLGIWDGLEESRLVAALGALAAAREPFPIEFSSVATFGGPECVVFLAPRPGETLVEMHRDVQAA